MHNEENMKLSSEGGWPQLHRDDHDSSVHEPARDSSYYRLLAPSSITLFELEASRNMCNGTALLL